VLICGGMSAPTPAGRPRAAATALAATLAVAAFSSASPARAQVATDPSLVFDRVEAMVPMRDGVRLETELYVPKGAKEKLPILLMRTPYGFSPDPKGFSQWLSRPWLADLVRDGYLVAFQNVRGRFKSEGVYTMEGAPRDRKDPRATDEASDAYDTVAWLVANAPGNDGKVGILGASIPGRLAAVAMLDPHPAVKAYSPQATPADNFLGDDDFHAGAFRAGVMMHFVGVMERSKSFSDVRWAHYDLYDASLALGPLGEVARSLGIGALPSWLDFSTHPTYDGFWKARALPSLLAKPPPGAAVLHVGGAFDQEDRRGPVALYQAMERGDAEGRNFLVQGPWAHRTWRLHEGDRLGAIPFGSATARFFREEVQAPFFACRLKGRCGTPLPEALVFQTGTNVWQRLPAWPPKEARERSVYLQAGGRLSFEPPTAEGEGEADAFLSDPAKPVPFLPRPIPTPDDEEGWEAVWPASLVADQRFAHGRPDVLAWTSEPLAEDVVVAGGIAAHLFVSTTGTDADWVAKLVDVHPERDAPAPALRGYQLPVAAEILRGRFRRGFEKPERFTPGKVEEVTVDLLTRSHVFRKGHRIMVQVQSTWFPLYDRNPQTFVPNVFEAKAGDFRAQTHRVHRSRRFPSRVTFATVPAG
jgi:putative CocE/NonD family hydrolase